MSGINELGCRPKPCRAYVQENYLQPQKTHNNALHRAAIPLRSIAADELGGYGIKLAVFGMHELFYAGVEPNEMLLKDSVVGMEEYNAEAGENLSWRLKWKIVKNKEETTK